ncbi:PPE domain-containing protein [Nocardia sp. CA2R105]|uniref:PPE domain-containing protein n=1 Tax=Nocardia coffeae TaxID=2873381 RepID=UPI001CA782D5|nr:PPE domain-containing protein [Nocardia coffeae]MBY8862737.1 PPE domain-containing protein [Nocardia coffeae]
MEPLNVDPAELATVASMLADLAQTTGQGLPTGWVLPAGSDHISGGFVPGANTQAANLFNGTQGVLHLVHQHAHKTGSAAADYTEADDTGARTVGGNGRDVLTNPVAEPTPPTPRQAPMFNLPVPGVEIDPLTFAQQLRAGSGTGPANAFAGNIRNYLGTSHQTALAGVDQAAQTLQNWTPVGTEAAAQLNEHRSWLDQLGSTLGQLADGIETYTSAFDTAMAKHPTPEEIIAARKELLAAMRSKDEAGVADALAKTQEQNARSADAITGYTTTVDSKTAQNNSSSNSSDSSQMMSTLASILPTMMSSMMSNGMSGLNQDNSQNSLDDLAGYAGDYGSGAYDSLGGGGVPIGDLTDAANAVDAGSKSFEVASMPMATSAASLGSSLGLPRASVIEPLQASSAAAGRAAAGGSPYMPYMPMSPGMGQTGGSQDRNRVVAWHPDRLMYVDDTPHTEQVIGEKPTIAPTVTPPTPSNAQTPSQSGGTA